MLHSNQDKLKASKLPSCHVTSCEKDMDRTERFYKIEQLLISRRVVPISIFLEVLEISQAIFNRDLDYLRDRMPAFSTDRPQCVAVLT